MHKPISLRRLTVLTGLVIAALSLGAQAAAASSIIASSRRAFR